MNHRKLAAPAVLALCALPLFAQQDVELHEWMEDSDKAVLALKKLDAKTGPQAVMAAERLGGIYEEMIGFWRQRNAVAAIKSSEAGKAAAVQLAAAAHAGDAEQAAAAFKSITATCKSCHDGHRERLAGGKYRIK